MLRINFAFEGPVCKFWSQRCKELDSEEKALHANLKTHSRLVLRGKRLLLSKEMLEAYEYPDKTLVAKSHVFPVGLKQLSQSAESALKVAKDINGGICKQVSSKTLTLTWTKRCGNRP